MPGGPWRPGHPYGSTSAGRGHGELADDAAALRRTARADHRYAHRRGAGYGHHDDRRRLGAVAGEVDEPWALAAGQVADAPGQVGEGGRPRPGRRGRSRLDVALGGKALEDGSHL